MQIHHIKLTKAQLDKVPSEERTLLILCAHAANELNVLIKLFRFSSTHPWTAEAEKEATNAQSMIIGRILSGKLYECWELLRKSFFGAKLSKTYEPMLDADATKALSELKQYFAKDNIIKTVRNKHAFHYAPDQIEAGYAALAQEESLNIYLASANMNTLYAFADVIAGYSLIVDINPGDMKKAYDSLIHETSQVLGWLNHVISACLVIVTTEYLGSNLDQLGATTIEVEQAPDWKTITIPYFVAINDDEIT